jgi:hypothetical protein
LMIRLAVADTTWSNDIRGHESALTRMELC